MPDNTPIKFPLPLDLPIFTAKDVGELVDIPSRRVVLLVEQGIVIPSAQAQGRGSSRRHSFESLFTIGILDIMGAKLGIAPRYLRELSSQMSTIRSEEVLDADLPDNLPSVSLAEALTSYGSGDGRMPTYLLQPFEKMTILASSRGPLQAGERELWMSNWRYAYSVSHVSKYRFCLYVDYRTIARDLLRRTASYLQRESVEL